MGAVAPLSEDPRVRGWTSTADAVVLLPGDCRREFRTGGKEIQVRLTLPDPSYAKKDADAVRGRMGSTLMRVAAGVAKNRGCAAGELGSAEPVADAAAYRDLPADGTACGLPGFTPVREDQEFRPPVQRYAGKLDSTWNCALTRDEGAAKRRHLGAPESEYMTHHLATFSVTSNKPTVEEFEKEPKAAPPDDEQRSDRILTCDDERYLVQMLYPSTKNNDDRPYSEKQLAPRKTVFREFTRAVETKLGCDGAG